MASESNTKRKLITSIIILSMFDRNKENKHKYRNSYLSNCEYIELIEMLAYLKVRKEMSFDFTDVIDSEESYSAILALPELDYIVLHSEIMKEKERKKYCKQKKVPYTFSPELAGEIQELTNEYMQEKKESNFIEISYKDDEEEKNKMSSEDVKMALQLILPKTNK